MARRVRALLDGGARPEGIGVVARDLAPYALVLRRHFRRLGVPFSGRGRARRPGAGGPAGARLPRAAPPRRGGPRRPLARRGRLPRLPGTGAGASRWPACSSTSGWPSTPSAPGGCAMWPSSTSRRSCGERSSYALPIRQGLRTPAAGEEGQEGDEGETYAARRRVDGALLRAAVRTAGRVRERLAAWPDEAPAAEHFRRLRALLVTDLGWDLEAGGCRSRPRRPRRAGARGAGRLPADPRRAAPAGRPGLRGGRRRAAGRRRRRRAGAHRHRGARPHVRPPVRGRLEPRRLPPRHPRGPPAAGRPAPGAAARAARHPGQARRLRRGALSLRLAPLGEPVRHPLLADRGRRRQAPLPFAAPARPARARRAPSLWDPAPERPAAPPGGRARGDRRPPGAAAALRAGARRGPRRGAGGAAGGRSGQGGSMLDPARWPRRGSRCSTRWTPTCGCPKGGRCARGSAPTSASSAPRPGPDRGTWTSMSPIWRRWRAAPGSSSSAACSGWSRRPIPWPPCRGPIRSSWATWCTPCWSGSSAKPRRRRRLRPPWPGRPAERFERSLHEEAARLLALEGIVLPGLARALAERARPLLAVAREMDWPDGAAVPVLHAEQAEEVEVAGRRRAARAGSASAPTGSTGLPDGLRFTDYKTGRPLSTARKPEVRRRHFLERLRQGTLLQAAAYLLAAQGEPARGALPLSEAGSGRSRGPRVRGRRPEDREAAEAFANAVSATLPPGTRAPSSPAWSIRPAGTSRRAARYCAVAEACLRGDSGARLRLFEWTERATGRAAGQRRSRRRRPSSASGGSPRKQEREEPEAGNERTGRRRRERAARPRPLRHAERGDPARRRPRRPAGGAAPLRPAARPPGRRRHRQDHDPGGAPPRLEPGRRLGAGPAAARRAGPRPGRRSVRKGRGARSGSPPTCCAASSPSPSPRPPPPRWPAGPPASSDALARGAGAARLARSGGPAAAGRDRPPRPRPPRRPRPPAGPDHPRLLPGAPRRPSAGGRRAPAPDRRRRGPPPGGGGPRDGRGGPARGVRRAGRSASHGPGRARLRAAGDRRGPGRPGLAPASRRAVLDEDPLGPGPLRAFRERLAAEANAVCELLAPAPARRPGAQRALAGDGAGHPARPLPRRRGRPGPGHPEELGRRGAPREARQRICTSGRRGSSAPPRRASSATSAPSSGRTPASSAAWLDHLRRIDPALLEAGRRALGPASAPRSRRELRARGIATFDALLTGAEALLARHPEVRARVRRQIDQLLVDEFQDTDRVQCELLRWIALDGPRDERPGLFLVGDPKQSIYGWRSADLRAYDGFVDLARRHGGDVEPLVENFRSVPAILSEVARVIAPVMREAPGLQPPFEPLLACERRREDPGFVRGDHRELAPRSSTGSPGSAAGRQDLGGRGGGAGGGGPRRGRPCRSTTREGVAWREVAILLRGTGDLDVYLEALRRARIPFVVGPRQAVLPPPRGHRGRRPGARRARSRATTWPC